ncbi:P-loop NTPase fold protein [Jiangella sp. DSM 45060]|uniref:KAP family P-loop NTPase fold protein n=1 Tax=Jiangella sp. DSM 45060 TaxID=1798224 RepID=UPI00087B7426|nr:P-loop NTPase fold protein [Jiangella sp. DSM 45060]SDT70711.1 KAP family P-loop domain-containing protein [Jiangella sp. DSM 45060]
MARGAAGNAGAVKLHPGDLVDDRELAAVEDDRLAHEGIVDQLAALVTSVNTPSNVALYGPWGSGKSGVANLLRRKIDGKNGVRFVRFDAFKYADVPLRRNFISAVANGLDRKDSKYHADLYSGRTKTDISVPPSTILKLLGVFALLMVGLTLILGAIVAIVAAVQQGDFRPSFRSLSKQAILAGLLPATLLAALITLASKTFSVDRSLAKPESDEQFEQLFRDLVSDTGAKRMVVFVDELDRCSATEVVATLDTVRTFLGIEPCVFIIAADQNVLEEALTRAAKQETPVNEANPYYSTGSAYLDKVFQYQVSLPPLLSQSVSKYANTLVGGRGGVWGEINTEYVLSVLVPTHVTSPRRVKHLLNTFALTYRLAEERHRAGLLSESPRDSAAAIARLVCLRVEFPLFARHLEVDAKLPSLVLQLIRDNATEFPSGVSDRARELARAYALDGAPPATVLPSGNEAGEEEAERVEPTVKAHNKQLLNYLSRTRQVSGPSRDLIYMQSTGTVFGLDGELALAIEQAAEDGDISSLRRRVEGLGEAERQAALELLAQQIRTGSGVAGPNAARSFLLLIEAVPTLPIKHVVDAVIEAICVLHDDATGVLDEDTVVSAWTLAKTGSEAGAAALRGRVVAATIAPDSKASTDFLMDDALVALDAASTEMSAYLASLLVSDEASSTLTRLFAAPDDDVVQILTILRTPVAAQANAAVKEHEAWVAERKEAAAAQASTRPTAARQASTPEPEEEPYHPRVLLVALADEAGSRETPVQHETLRFMLAIDVQEARDVAESLIGRSEPTAQPELATAILPAAYRRVFALWPIWLKGIAPEAIRPIHAVWLRHLVSKLWSQQPAEDETNAALDALAPLVAALPEDRRPDLTSDVLEKIEDLITEPEGAAARSGLLVQTDRFAIAGFVNNSRVAEAVASTLQDTLAQSLSPVGRDDAMYKYVAVRGAAALAALSGSISDEQLNGILSEAGASPWLDDFGKCELPLILATEAGRPEAAVKALPTAQAVAEVVRNYGGAAAHAATLWVDIIQPEQDELALVLDRLLFEKAVSAEFAEAARQAQRTWSPAQHRAFLDIYLAKADAEVPADLTLRTIGLDTADDGELADLLSGRFSQATNNNQRQAVVTLWAKANIRDTAARKRLIETIVYGLIDLHAGSNGNASAVDLALTALDKLGNPLPHGVKGALGQRLKAAVEGNKALEEKALRVLPRLGYSTSKGFLGRTRRVDYTST